MSKYNRGTPGVIPVAIGTRYLRSGRQKHDQDLVECCRCSYAHRHRAPSEGELVYERAASCRRSLRYRVVIDKVVPAEVPTRREVVVLAGAR